MDQTPSPQVIATPSDQALTADSQATQQQAVKGVSARLFAKLMGYSIEEAEKALKEQNSPQPQQPSPEILDLKSKKRDQNPFPLAEAHTRNVLMVGRTRSGKSTSVGILKDPCFIPPAMSIFSDTVLPSFQTFALEKAGAAQYTLNIIDTPGLDEVKPIGQEARTDTAILNTINVCLDHEITMIHTLIIFTSLAVGITEADIRSFKTFMDNFWHKDIKVLVCVTKAEDKTQQWKQNLAFDLAMHAEMGELLDKDNVSMVFMGAVPSSTTDTLSIREMTDRYEAILVMREKLLETIFASEASVKLVDLPVTKGRIDGLGQQFDSLFSILDTLEQQSDFTIATNQELISSFNRGLRSLLSWEGLLYDPKLAARFFSFKVQLANFISTKTASLTSDQRALLEHTLIM